MLNADVPEGIYVELRGGDPAEALAEGVVWIHDIPVTGCIRNGHRAFGPVIVPLRDLDEGQGRKEEAKNIEKHGTLWESLQNLSWVLVFDVLCVSPGLAIAGRSGAGAATCGRLRQSALTCGVGLVDPAFLLDPSRFPRRLDLDLSDQAVERLQRLSASTGRSVSDLAADLLQQALADMPSDP